MARKYVTEDGHEYRSLSDLMEFDHVIRVHADGSISEPSGVHAPEVTWSGGTHDVSGEGWDLLNGYSGQHGYSGPVMHPSEFIGGGMERDITSQPGYYVAVVVSDLDSATEDETPDAGWAVAFMPAHADYPHEPGRLYDCAACEAKCFCKPGYSRCIFSGEHNHTGEPVPGDQDYDDDDTEF